MEAVAAVAAPTAAAPPPLSPTASPRVKRPSISIEIFQGTLGDRLRWFLLLGLPITLSILAGALVSPTAAAVGFSLVAGLAAHSAIPEFGRLLLHAGRKGADLNKPDRPALPESLGIAVGAIYLVTMFLFIPIPFAPWLLRSSRFTAASLIFPFEQLGAYTAALLSITCMLFLGFADDVLNLKWRHKVLLPAIASLPLLMIYSVSSGRTEVVVPWPLRGLLGPLLHLGVLYYLYMAMLSIFCTHSINILAGVNGVEVGQSCVIALCVIAHNLWAITRGGEPVQGHHLSLTLILPFLAVSLALLRHNWWPARVFVGDTYCYFAGMTFAVVGILGHFGKTLLLFFLPQIFNFVYSLPQLAGLVACPRHRMPRLNEQGALEASQVSFALSRRNGWIVRLAARLRLLKIYAADGKGHVTTNNFTLLNLLLVAMGPMREDRLAMLLMTVQVLTGLLAFLVRHHLAAHFFPPPQ